MPVTNDSIKDETAWLDELAPIVVQNNTIDPRWYERYDVKRGLRNENGSGVLVGLTGIGDVHGYVIDEREKVPVEGRLRYRSVDVSDIVAGCKADGRFGFEEVCYLLLFGQLPTTRQLENFENMLGAHRQLPNGFTEDMILAAPSKNIMNKLARSTLALYSYDETPDDTSVRNVLRQSMELIARFPTMAAYGYQAKSHYHGSESLFIHTPLPDKSAAEN
ncbi:MAG: citrate/2-methylcitrate synthase, partial [Planctomycetota bacterium]